MLQSYLPVIVFVGLGIIVGSAFTALNRVLGPSRPGRVKSEPYECGLPTEVTRTFRFGISFYMVAMLFILFDIEVVFVVGWATVFKELIGSVGWPLLWGMLLFLGILEIGHLYIWRQGALNWAPRRTVRAEQEF